MFNRGQRWSIFGYNGDGKSLFRRKNDLAEKTGGRYYGDGGTIHQTGEVNVELDENGQVVSVWFRCQMLPFTQRVVDDRRAAEMRRAYSDYPVSRLSGVEIVDR